MSAGRDHATLTHAGEMHDLAIYSHLVEFLDADPARRSYRRSMQRVAVDGRGGSTDDVRRGAALMGHERGHSGRYFTEAARIKALEVRRAKASEPKSDADVFITRHAASPRLFVWEIRQFGGVLLDRSATGFKDPHDARAAGDAALARLRTHPDPAALPEPTDPLAADV